MVVLCFEILQNQNCMIGLLETYPCQNRDQLLARERYWIEKIDCVNKCVPTRTKSEYKSDKCGKVRDYNQKYFANPENAKKAKETRRKYQATEKSKADKAYRKRMTREFGDRYCNALTRICWDALL